MNETIKIKSVVGHLLDNQLSWPKNPQYPVLLVILCHGFLAHRRFLFFPALRQALRKNGYAVLTYDQPGHGGSPGRKQEVTLPRNVDDLKRIIDILEKDKRLDLSQLTVVGHSLGGFSVLMTAEVDPRIKRVITIGAALNFEKGIKQLFDRGKLFRRGQAVYYRAAPFLMAQKCEESLWPYHQKFNFEQRVKRIKAEVLLIGGEKDRTVPMEFVEETYRELECPKKIVMIKNSGHFFMKPRAKKQMLNEVVKWLHHTR